MRGYVKICTTFPSPMWKKSYGVKTVSFAIKKTNTNIGVLVEVFRVS
jgi:hypothetical protein